MAVPDFQTLMLPVLKQFADGKEKTPADVRGPIAGEFKLTAADLAILLPSGGQTTFANRVAWALGYLKQARLLESPRRAHYQLTDRGKEILRSTPERINIAFLERYPDFQAFRHRGAATANPAISKTPDENDQASIEGPALTPDEQIRLGAARVRENLVAQLLERIKRGTPAAFERLVVDLLVAMATEDPMRMRRKSLARGAMEESTGSLRKIAWVSRAFTCRRSAGKTRQSVGQQSSSLQVPFKDIARARAFLLPPRPFREKQSSMRKVYRLRLCSLMEPS